MTLVPGAEWAVGASSLEQLLDRLGVATFRSTPDGRLLDASPAWLRLLGLPTLDEARRLDLAKLYVREADRAELIASVLATGEARDHVVQLRRADGHPLWVSVVEVATTLPDGSVVIDGILLETGVRETAARVLRGEAERYRLLLEQANVAIFLADAATGMLIHANRKGLELVDRTLPELQNMHQRDLHPPEVVADYEAIFRDHAAELASRAEGEVVDRSGTRIPVSISASVVELEGREVVQGVFHDLRELHLAYQALEESAYRYRQLVELSPDAIAVHADGRIVFANREALRLFGAVGPEDLLGRSVLEVVHPSSLPIVQERVRHMLASGEAAPLVEERFVRLDGGVIDVEVAAGPITYKGAPAIQVVFRDIGERNRMLAALERSQAQQAAVLAGLPVAIYAAEVPSVDDVSWMSESIKRFTGFDAHDFVAEPKFWSSHIHPDDRERVIGAFRAGIVSGETRVEYRWKVADGSYRWFAEHARCVGFQGEVAEVIGTVADITEQRAAEEALRHSEEKYRALVEELLEVIFELDAAGHLTYASPAIERVSGFGPDEVTGRHFAEFVDPADLETLHTEYLSVLDRDLHPSEYRIRHRDGGTRWVRSSSRPVVEDGAVVGIRGVLVDITERRGAEEALQRSARRLEAMHEVDLAILAARSVNEITTSALRTLRQQIGADRAAIIVFDPGRGEGEYVAVNAEPGLGEEAGAKLPQADFVAAELEDGHAHYVPDLSAEPDRAPVGEALVQRGIRTLLICSFVIERGVVARLALSSRSVDAFSTEHRAVASEVAGVLGVALSQTRLRERLEEQQRTLALLVAQLPDGIVLLGEDGVMALANPVAVDYLGMLGHHDLRSPIVTLGGVRLAELLQARPGGLPHELSGEEPTPRLFEVRARATVGAPERAWILLIHDATRERQIARSLEQQDRLAVIGHLAGGLAHDFNNYLTAILTHAELLLRDVGQSELAREALRVIKEQSERSAKLVRSILDFSRASASERYPVDVGRFVVEVAQVLTRTIPERIRIDVEVPENGSCVVMADPAQLQQVLMNVAINARDAMTGQGVLRLAVHPEAVAGDAGSPVAGMGAGTWVHVAVEDTGSGIEPSDLPHVFEPFFTTKAAGHGTGLGLSQVYGLVRQHDGFVTVESEVGRGTTIHIFLPQELLRAEPRQQVEAEPESGHGELVLLAEDEQEVRSAIEQALLMLGYRVAAVENGASALKYLRAQGGADLLITDLTMPVMGGDELAAAVQREFPALPVVVLTGYAAGRVDELRELGVVTTVQKPLSMAELAQVVRDAIR